MRSARAVLALVLFLSFSVSCSPGGPPEPPEQPVPPPPDWLWVTVFSENRVLAFDEEHLLSGGTGDLPARVIDLGEGRPYGLDFDADGTMWVGASFSPGLWSAGYVAMVTPADRSTSGSPPAGVELTELGGFDVGGAMAFHPPPR